MKKLNFFSILFLSLFAQAGWISSGGELFQLGKNPWFVRSAKDINVCIVIDQSAMSSTEATIKSSVQGAFDYWKNEFQFQNSYTGLGAAKIGNQNVVIQSVCGADTDVRFIFGYGALNDKDPNNEIAFLQDPQKYVGVTVRTDYDMVNLKGKGFVYISGDIGTHPYHNPGHLIQKAWEKEKLLQYALIHEVGHVMGIPHTGVGIMSEVFLDQLLNKKFVKYYLDSPMFSFLNPPLVFDVCQNVNGSISATFFQADPATQCLSVQGSMQVGADITFEISGKMKPESTTTTKLGTVRGKWLIESALSAKPAIVLHLPQEQKVFNDQERLFNSFMIGPAFTEGAAKANFISVSSPKPYDLHLDLKNDTVTFVGVLNGKQQVVLYYSLPSLMKALLPIVVTP